MNIKRIVDKIVIESDVSPAEYPVADRIEDVNSEYLSYIEKSVQIGSKEPASEAETTEEIFNVTSGSNTFIRTIKDVPIQRVDYKSLNGSKWVRLERDLSRGVNTWCGCNITFFANEKEIFVENGRDGEIRVTYARGQVVTFTLGDYNSPNPPSPDFLPETFHDLLWLRPALYQAEMYKKDRVSYLRNRLERLETLFNNHYGRDAVNTSQLRTEEDSCSGLNYR